jgi:hypothetical protein
MQSKKKEVQQLKQGGKCKEDILRRMMPRMTVIQLLQNMRFIFQPLSWIYQSPGSAEDKAAHDAVKWAPN